MCAEIARHLQPGDSLTVDMDPAASRLPGLGVNLHLDKPEEAATGRCGAGVRGWRERPHQRA